MNPEEEFKEQIKKALTHYSVTPIIKENLDLGLNFGFLIYIGRDGSYNIGNIVIEEGKMPTEEELKEEAEKLERRIEEKRASVGPQPEDPFWIESAKGDIRPYLQAYRECAHLKDLERNSGLVILTKWREDILDDECEEFLKEYLASGGQHPTILDSMLHYRDYFDLNGLNSRYPNSALVIGRRIREGSNDVKLVIMEQKPEFIAGEAMWEAINLYAATLLAPEVLDVYLKEIYNKIQGTLDLEKRTVLLDSDFEM